jgi:hypothetical protein
MFGGDPGLQHFLDLVVRHGVKLHDAPVEFLQTLVFRRREDHRGWFAVLGDDDRSAEGRVLIAAE